MSDRLTVRSYRSNFTIRCGPATTVGRLIPIRHPKPAEPNICSPDYTAVEQFYRDGDGNLWKPDQLPRGIKQKDGTFIPVDKDAIKEAKKSELPKNVLDLSVYPVKDVVDKIFPSDNNCYVFDTLQKDKKGVPIKDDPVNVEWHDFIYHILDKGNVALLGRANFSDVEGLYQLFIYQGNLAIQKMLYPEDLNQYEPRKISLSPAVKKKALAVAKSLTREFDADNYRNHIAERVAIAESGQFDPTIKVIAQSEEPAFDIMAALEAFEGAQ